MELTLNLNSRLQPMHRHDLEDALQEILEKINLGEVMGGGTLQNPQTGEIESCDIEIHLNDDKQDSINRLVELVNKIGIPKGSALLCMVPEFKIEVGTLEGLAYYGNGTELPDEVYESCDIKKKKKQKESPSEPRTRPRNARLVLRTVPFRSSVPVEITAMLIMMISLQDWRDCAPCGANSPASARTLPPEKRDRCRC